MSFLTTLLAYQQAWSTKDIICAIKYICIVCQNIWWSLQHDFVEYATVEEACIYTTSCVLIHLQNNLSQYQTCSCINDWMIGSRSCLYVSYKKAYHLYHCHRYYCHLYTNSIHRTRSKRICNEVGKCGHYIALRCWKNNLKNSQIQDICGSNATRRVYECKGIFNHFHSLTIKHTIPK